MFLLDLLANGSLTSLLADSAAQLTAVSILGFITVKLLGGKAAPVRSLAAAGVLASMLCVFILSVAFHASDVVWYKADISRLAPKPALVPAVSAPLTEAAAPALMENPAAMPDMRMENSASSANTPAAVIKNRPVKSFEFKAVHCINALGLIWAGGIIFMLLKLGYGLAFIRGFRFGLNRISDEKITSLSKEGRLFEPPQAGRDQAYVKSMAEYEKRLVYRGEAEKVLKDSERFLEFVKRSLPVL